MDKEPKLIEGGFFEDERGRLDFVNDFDLSAVKRCYFTTNASVDFFRGWQGHIVESRWFYCVEGEFEVELVKIDDWHNPSSDLIPLKYQLSSKEPKFLYIPSGFVNGFKALQENSKLMVMSDFELGANPNDDVRFESTKWKKKKS